MTNDEMRIAIAECLGWKFHDEHIEMPSGTVVDCEFLTVAGVDKSWPNYPEDLNACHEMEKTLTLDECLVYEKYLVEGGTKFVWSATASQRCEAFLRTKGLWKEGK